MQKTAINRKEVKYVKNFGVELELYNVDKELLQKALALKNIPCYIEGYNHRHSTTAWRIVPDGSIQGINPAELVSPILNGIDGLKQLREVMLTLYFIDAKVNSSCGMHVHHEARSLSQRQLTNVMKFYARCERTVDAFMPLSRKRDNQYYCKSMIGAYNRARYTDLENLGKYYKVNFNKINIYGTVEFRHHQGTIEFEKAYHWIVFTSRMLHKAKDKSSRSAMNFIERAWTPKHLGLSKRTWNFYKARMKKLDDLHRSEQSGTIRLTYDRRAAAA